MDVSILDLWLPIVSSGIAVFFLSFIAWMVLPHHRSDYGPVPDEDGTMAHFGDIPRGQYMFPHCKDPQQMNDPDWLKKRNDGPSGMLTILPRGPQNMVQSMLQSFLFNIVISIVTAYLATIAFAKGADGTAVFRFTATAAFMGYAGALGWQAIWFFATWKSIGKMIADGLIYGIATGAAFMYMWPGI